MLDVDVVRGLLSSWFTAPVPSGLLARQLALAMCTTHLAAGHDVIVPQFLGQPHFVVALERVAGDAGVPFVEIALLVPPAVASERLRRRRAREVRPEDTVGGPLADLTEPGALDALHRRLRTVLGARPATHLLDAEADAEAVRRHVSSLLTSA